jgi:hypothetical protein
MRRPQLHLLPTVPVVLALLVAGAGCGTGPNATYGGGSDVQPPTPTTRTGSYGGLEGAVPRDWALGTLGCAEPAGPYVARPDPAARCSARRVPRPTRAAVWFDSPLPVGDRDAGALRLRTVERAGVRLSVAGRTRADVDRLLATAHRVDVDANGCRTRAETAGGYPDEGLAGVVRFSVCVYPGADAPLLWSAELSPAAGRAFLDADQAGRALRRPPVEERGPVVVLVVTADQRFGTYPATAYYRVAFGPGRVTGGPGNRVVALTAAMARPWDVAGVREYVGPASRHALPG